jgi:GTPase Era involved in 16S rRNA processing
MQEQLNSLEINSFLNFVDKVLERHVIDGLKSRELKTLSVRIRNRLLDKQLYLAVIGEFSSGKSTFINALLQQRLLKAACEATTASATLIKKGTHFQVKITFIDDQVMLASEVESENLKDKIGSIIKESLGNTDVFKLLDLLTSTQLVANHVSRIEILHPNTDLPEKIVIIDTPGISAGAEYAEEHSKTTERIVSESADLAVVLIPAEKAMSNSLIQFLDTTLRHLLDRCIFIITAMDRISQDERAPLIGFVKHQLSNKIGINTPEVYSASAITMIPMNRIPPSLREELEFWRTEFKITKNQIFQKLGQQRNTIIAERLNFLLKQLTTELEVILKLQKKKLQKEQTILANGAISTVERVIEKLLEKHNKTIRNELAPLLNKAKTLVNKYKLDAIEGSDKVVKEAGWGIKSYGDSVEPKVRKIANEEAEKYIRELNKQLNSLRGCCEEICEDFIKQFRANYANFPALDMNISVPSVIVDDIKAPDLQFSSSKKYVEEQNSEDTTGRNAGAIIGGILGSILAPGLGTAIGAAIGGGIGYGNGGDELEDRQRKIQQLNDKEISKFFDQYLEKVKNRIVRKVEGIENELNTICESHIERYESKVRVLIEAHEEKKRKVKNEIAHLNKDLSGLELFSSDLALFEKTLIKF